MTLWQWLKKALFGIQPQLPKPVLVKQPEKEESKMIKGVDVSHYQAAIKWDEIAAAGFKFAFLKATDGLNGDPAFQTFRARAKAAGLLVGAYHYFRFDIDPVLQAQKFFHTTGGQFSGELPFVLDVEWDRFSKRYHEGTVMDDAAAEAVFKCRVEFEKAFGSKPMIYTNYYFWNQGGFAFSDCPLWVPNYHAQDISEVKIPKPWEKATFWQFSESLKLAGVEAIDGDYFLGTEEELKALVKQ